MVDASVAENSTGEIQKIITCVVFFISVSFVLLFVIQVFDRSEKTVVKLEERKYFLFPC